VDRRQTCCVLTVVRRTRLGCRGLLGLLQSCRFRGVDCNAPANSSPEHGARKGRIVTDATFSIRGPVGQLLSPSWFWFTRMRAIRAALAQPHQGPVVEARRRRRPAAVQDVIVGIVKREQTWLLDSRLREYRRCEYERQNGCRAEDFEFGHGLSASVNRWAARFENSRLLCP